MLKLVLKRPSAISPRYGQFLLGILCGWFLTRFISHFPTPSSLYLESVNWNTANAHYPVSPSSINLTESVRVLCWVMTTPANHQEKVPHIKSTWGARCNKLLIMSSVADPTIGSIALPVEEGRKSLWNKTREAFRYIYEHHLEGYDWFFKADDDTYVVVENLRYFLHSYSSELPIYFGSKFRYPQYVKQGYFSGGAGYVLSREAVRRFHELALRDEELCSSAYDTEDLEMGKCMESVNVTAGDSRDDLGRKRFLPMEPVFHLAGSITEDPDFWYNQYSYYEPLYGRNCCSDLAISFHYVPGKHMHMMDYLIYDLHAWGSIYQNPPLSRMKTPQEAMIVDEPYPISTMAPRDGSSTIVMAIEEASTATSDS
ncbi:glycoprotein-N-acetylgalactosamine 3-beta-galactosyltransferase 1-like [Anopheles nili]|uniref:glycoprotein-N-acetylgalactosamine 3-beta-galactosyltransferase 1-like n=1 Tax=Anopheles nili TaxID=185578 RepID=UPI00237B673E|nr:glycoprotein-N-acetylgalactosamine 3-beta-galactosyltransferase 1-like [Anopheles nili]